MTKVWFRPEDQSQPIPRTICFRIVNCSCHFRRICNSPRNLLSNSAVLMSFPLDLHVMPKKRIKPEAPSQSILRAICFRMVQFSSHFRWICNSPCNLRSNSAILISCPMDLDVMPKKRVRPEGLSQSIPRTIYFRIVQFSSHSRWIFMSWPKKPFRLEDQSQSIPRQFASICVLLMSFPLNLHVI